MRKVEDLNRMHRRTQATLSAVKAEINPSAIASMAAEQVIARITPLLEKMEASPDRTDEVISAVSNIKFEETDLKPLSKQIEALKKLLKATKPTGWELHHERNYRGQIVKTVAVPKE